MPSVPDPDLVPFEPPDHPTIRAAFRNIIESYPRALYDEQGLVRYRTRFLDSVLVSEPELIHDILVARAHLRTNHAVSGKSHETSPPQILASGCGRCRAAGGVARRDGASLSDAAGAH